MVAKSDFIFKLIDEFEIFSKLGSPNYWSDDDLESFTLKYKQQADYRDEALYNYLTNSINLFRCHLPYSKWTLAVARNVVWYYDELIITDPILDLLKNPHKDLEYQKNRLQNALKFILEFKESIIGGYILFAGDRLVPNKTGSFKTESELLITDSKVLEGFENLTLIAKKASPINDNVEDNLTHLHTEYNGMWGENKSMSMYIPDHILNKGKLDNGIFFDFVTPFQVARKEDLIAMGKVDMLTCFQSDYAKDITIVLEAITNAQRFNAPVLFYRDVDRTVAKQYALLNSNPNSHTVSKTIYDFTTPYLKDIPPDRLFEIRNQIPQSFNDFRYFLYELVVKTMKSTNNPDEIKYKIDQEVNSMFNKLQVEINNVERKWKVHGLAAPIIAGIGTLSLSSSGIDYAKIYSFLLGTMGGIKSLTTFFDTRSDKEKLELNPVYFMWKAKSDH